MRLQRAAWRGKVLDQAAARKKAWRGVLMYRSAAERKIGERARARWRRLFSWRMGDETGRRWR